MTPRLLLVDDDDSNALTLSALLEDEGFAVDVAATCALAREHLAEKAYHAVVLDSGLPDGDGRDLVLSARVLAPGATVVLHTGLGDGETGEADALVIKGAPFEELLRAVTSWRASPPSPR